MLFENSSKTMNILLNIRNYFIGNFTSKKLFKAYDKANQILFESWGWDWSLCNSDNENLIMYLSYRYGNSSEILDDYY